MMTRYEYWSEQNWIILNQKEILHLALQRQLLCIKEQELLIEKMERTHTKRKRIKGDGACAFRSVADQIYGTQEKHHLVRDAACQQLLDYPELYSHLFATEADFFAYVDMLSRPKTWADQLALKAICDTFDATLVVLVSDLDYDYDYYHPTWENTTTTVYTIVASHCHMDSLYGVGADIPLTPEKKRYMARTGKFFLPEVMENGNTHTRFED